MIPHIYLSFICSLMIITYTILLDKHPSLHLKGILDKKVDDIHIENISATVKDLIFYKNGRLIGYYRIDIENDTILDIKRNLILTDIDSTVLIKVFLF